MTEKGTDKVCVHVTCTSSNRQSLLMSQQDDNSHIDRASKNEFDAVEDFPLASDNDVMDVDAQQIPVSFIMVIVYHTFSR